MYCFRKGETRRPNMGDHYEVVEIHQLILYRPKLLCRNQAQVSKQPLWLQRTAGNIGRPGLEQFEVTQEGPSRLSCIWLFQGGRDSLTVSISIFMSNMLVMVRSRLPSICLEQCDDDSLVWKTRQTVAVNGHFGGSSYLPPCVQNLAALHFPFL